MKKIKFFGFIIILFLFLFPSIVFADSDVDSSDFSDSSLISDDLKKLSLNLNDYFYSNNSDANHYFVIGVSESFSSSEWITSYLYLYNPIEFYSDNVGFSIGAKLNNCELNLICDKYCNYDSDDSSFISMTYLSNLDNHISKYKFQYFNIECSSRSYIFNSIYVDFNSSSYIQDLKFSGKISDLDSSQSSYDFYSTFYISEDVIVPVYLNNVDLDSSWSEFISHFGFNTQPVLFFYNFNSNQEFDSIVDISFNYIMNDISSYHVSSLINGSVDKVNYSQSSLSRTLYPKVYSYNWSDINYNFDYFKVPGKSRFSDNEFQNLSSFISKDLFDYQASVLFDIVPLESCCANAGFYPYVTNLSMTEITINNNGVIKHFDKKDIIDEDGEDNSIDENGNPILIIPTPTATSNFFSKMFDFLSKLFAKSKTFFIVLFGIFLFLILFKAIDFILRLFRK